MDESTNSIEEANSAPKKITLEFFTDRETTGAFRFQELTERGRRGVVGTLYLTKQFTEEFGWGKPQRLEVTIEVLDGKND